jgi:hypothetical protein
MSFLKFVERKREEVINRGQSFYEAKMMGAYPHSSRQPAAFHYYLTRLERCVPDSSKAEILFELVRAAYADVCLPTRESLTDKVRETSDSANGMLYKAYCFKAMRSASEMSLGDTGFFCSDDMKKLADQFLNDYESGNYDSYQIIEKYQSTQLNNDLGDE